MFFLKIQHNHNTTKHFKNLSLSPNQKHPKNNSPQIFLKTKKNPTQPNPITRCPFDQIQKNGSSKFAQIETKPQTMATLGFSLRRILCHRFHLLIASLHFLRGLYGCIGTPSPPPFHLRSKSTPPPCGVGGAGDSVSHH